MPNAHVSHKRYDRRRGGGSKSLYIGKLPYYPLNKL